MNHSLKLAIPLALGAAAAFLNFWAGSSSLKTQKFYRTKTLIHRGATLGSQDRLDFVEIPLDFVNREQLAGIAIAEGEFGRVANRKLKLDLPSGSLVFDQYFESPSPIDDLADGQEIWQVEVDSQLLSRGLLQIGDQVKFRFLHPELPEGIKQLVQAANEPISAASTETMAVGPFQVVTVGDVFYEDRQWEADGARINTLSVIVTLGEPRTRLLEHLLMRIKTGDTSVKLVRVVPWRDNKGRTTSP